MSASLVRKALDETTLASEEKLGNLSKASIKRLKPPKKNKKAKKLSGDKLLKQNLKILKKLECKVRHKPKEILPPAPVPVVEADNQLKKGDPKKKKKRNKQKQSDSVFSEEDFEKFEKEYFVTS